MADLRLLQYPGRLRHLQVEDTPQVLHLVQLLRTQQPLHLTHLNQVVFMVRLLRFSQQHITFIFGDANLDYAFLRHIYT